MAVSGGVDSMVMLDVLSKTNYIECIHINHMTRNEENILEYELVKNTCKLLGIYFHAYEYIHKNGNFQSEARNFRIQKYIDIINLRNLDAVALGHHLDDQVENVLMNEKKISSKLMNEWTKLENLNIYRPLLNLFKSEIYKYADENHIKFYEDPSNSSVKYKRNKVRNIELKGYDNLEKQKIINYEIVRINDLEKALSKNLVDMNINELNYYLHKLLSKGQKSNFSNNLISTISKSYSTNGSKYYKLPDSRELLLEYGNYRIKNEKNDVNHLHIKLKKGYNRYNGISFNVELDNAILRYRMNGDKIKVNNMTKKLSRYFIDNKIPKHERDNIPVVAVGDTVYMLIKENND